MADTLSRRRYSPCTVPDGVPLPKSLNASQRGHARGELSHWTDMGRVSFQMEMAGCSPLSRPGVPLDQVDEPARPPEKVACRKRNGRRSRTGDVLPALRTVPTWPAIWREATDLPAQEADDLMFAKIKRACRGTRRNRGPDAERLGAGLCRGDAPRIRSPTGS